MLDRALVGLGDASQDGFQGVQGGADVAVDADLALRAGRGDRNGGLFLYGSFRDLTKEHDRAEGAIKSRLTELGKFQS